MSVQNIPRSKEINNTCSICLEDLSSKLTKSMSLCHHVFHQSCLENTWKNENRKYTCPTCKRPDFNSDMHFIENAMAKRKNKKFLAEHLDLAKFIANANRTNRTFILPSSSVVQSVSETLIRATAELARHPIIDPRTIAATYRPSHDELQQTTSTTQTSQQPQTESEEEWTPMEEVE